MQTQSSTIRDLLVKAEEQYKAQDVFRYKVKKEGADGKKDTVIEAKTYTQFKDDTERFSAMLASIGEQGKHIAIIGATSYEWVVSFFGITDSGSVAVPLDAQLSAAELCELINRADVTTLVYDKIKEDAAQEAVTSCPDLKHIICMSDAGDIAELAEQNGKKIYSFWQEMEKQQPGFSYEPQPDELSTIMYTSGTTGKSKGVMLTHRNQAENATCLDMEIEPGTVSMSVLPIHHAYCLSMDILKGISVGATICINDSLMRVAKNLTLFKPNMILMVPLMIETFAKKLEETALIPAPIIKAKVFGNQFHTICSGGAYLDPAYLDVFKKYGVRILQGYGMTECAPVISTNLKDESKVGSVGKLMPNCEAKTVDSELWVKGSSVMQGYYKMPEETADTLEDGWLKTGDLGYVDEDGFVFLTGRKKNLIITKNGENVSPEEIENVIAKNRLVCEIIVRDADGVIEAEIFPDYDYAKKKKVKDIQATLQEIIDEYNKEAVLYKRIYKLKVREVEFEKNTTKKIKRY